MAANVSIFRRSLDDADGSLVKFDRHTTDVGRNIDKLSGRLGLFVDLAATLGPSLIPTLTAAVPLLTGLANQLGFSVIAGGSAILAFQGVGDALKAVNEQAVNPSAANLEKMNEAMAKLGPAGRDFVRELQAIRPEMQRLQDAAQAGLFPGMTEGIESLMTRMPEAQRIISEVTDTLGDLMSEAGDSLSGPQWDQFFAMLEAEARPTLMALGESIGQVTRGLAELWIAFAPLNRDFSQGMLDASENFAQWADGLSQTQDFADFMAYLEETGPQVRETLSATGGALLDVLEAAAPLGGPALAALKAFANVISAIANSDLGTPLLAAVAAMRAYSLAAGIAGRATKSMVGQQVIAATGFKTMRQDMSAWLNFGAMSRAEVEKSAAAGARVRSSFLKGAAGAAALGLATTGAGESMGVANTAILGLAGSMLGPWGAAAGAGIGAFIDLKAAGDPLHDTLTRINAAAAAGNWDAMAAGIASVTKQIDNLQQHSGLGDTLGDIGKTIGGVLHGDVSFGLTGPKTSKKANKEIRDAEMASIYAGREAAAATSNRISAAAAAAAAQGFRLTAAGAREAAGGIKAFTAAMEAANAVISRQNSWDNYRRALLDAKDALNETGPALRKNGDIIRGQGRDMQRLGLDQRATLRNMASGVAELSTQMKDVGRRNTFLRESRRDFINLATSMGMSRAAARALATQLGLIPRTTKPKVEEQGADASRKRIKSMKDEIQQLKNKMVHMDEKGAAAARARIKALQAAINALRDRTIHITTVRQNRGASGSVGAGAAPDAIAEGGTVHGQRQPYGDKVLTYLAPGEEVISNRYGQADRYREILKAINANAYANGGTVQRLARGGTVHGGDWDGVRAGLRNLRQELAESKKALRAERNERTSLVSKRKELRGTVRDQFLNDPFEGGDVWAAGGGDPMGKLKADIAKANAFKSTLYHLSKAGLRGDALAAVASSGDLGQAQALLASGGAKQFGTLFNQRAVAANAVGNYAGMAAYSGLQAENRRDIKELVATVKRLERAQRGHRGRDRERARETGREVGRAINGAAGKAKRRSR